jgi:DNA-directed RNA polymerase subunit RPC12/RpoP|tara:strand:+ start:214 stop:426 length:213 start_codon:yes stop_codon:yes gene_type:complete
MAGIGIFETQIVTGVCPECNTKTLLVSFEPHVFKCVNCDAILEQKVNGVIKYVIADENTKLAMRNLNEEA